MANAQTLVAPAVITAACAGVPIGGNTNGDNSAAYTFSGGGYGAGDTISNANLKVGLAATSRLYSFFDQTFTDIPAGATAQQQVDAAAIALGLKVEQIAGVAPGCTPSTFLLVCASAAKMTATITTSAAGCFRISIAASISQ